MAAYQSTLLSSDKPLSPVQAGSYRSSPPVQSATGGGGDRMLFCAGVLLFDAIQPVKKQRLTGQQELSVVDSIAVFMARPL
jgi:hypothetical protein